MEKKPFIAPGNLLAGGIITLKCKNLRIVSLEIRSASEYINVLASLEALSTLQFAELNYPFFYRPMYAILEDGYTMFRQAWHEIFCVQLKIKFLFLFRPELEFAKLLNGSSNNCNGSNSTSNGAISPALSCGDGANNCEWRITNVNKDFTVCASYGPTLIVPKAITDEQIIQSAQFRDGGRFPVLSYRHENGVSSFYGITIPSQKSNNHFRH